MSNPLERRQKPAEAMDSVAMSKEEKETLKGLLWGAGLSDITDERANAIIDAVDTEKFVPSTDNPGQEYANYIRVEAIPKILELPGITAQERDSLMETVNWIEGK